MVATVLIILFTIFIVVISCYLQQKWRWRSMRRINGPNSYPMLGCALEFTLNTEAFLKDTTRLMNIYGKKDYQIKIDIGLHICYILIANPDIAEFFLSSPKYIRKNFNYELFRSWLGNGLLISRGTYWQKRRKAITPAFHSKILDQFIPVFSTGADKLVEKLSKEVDKDVLDFYPFITGYTLDSICETAMGTTVNAQDNPDNEYVRAVKTLCRIIITRTFSIWKMFHFLFQFTNDYKLQTECEKIVHKFTKSVIKKRRAELQNTNLKDNKNDADMGIKRRQAFLDLLIVSDIDGKKLTDEDILEEVDTFMFEGHDTIASAIGFALYELSRNQEVQEKLYGEINAMFETDKESVPTINDLNELTYLEFVIKETLRLYPSVPLIARELDEDVTYNGITYTKGAQIAFYPLYMHRRSDLFENAEKFIPERFSEDNITNKINFAYIPFSAGPRNCIGQKFAMYEMKTVLLKIVQSFQLLPVDKKYDVILAHEIILKSANGIHLKLKKRE